MKLHLSLFLLLITFQVVAQNYPITGINISLPANPDANTANWGSGTSMFTITSTTKAENGRVAPHVMESKILVTIKKGGKKACGSYTGNTAPESNYSALTKVWSGINAVSLLGQDCVLTPGDYELCVQFFGYGAAGMAPLSEEKCKPFSIRENVQQTYQPPQVIAPADGTVMSEADAKKPITFRWIPVIPRPQDPVSYRLTVWQLMQGQTGVQAMKANQPIITKDVDNLTQAVINNLLSGPCLPPYLCNFIWNVQALTHEGKPIGENNGIGNPFGFSVSPSYLPDAPFQTVQVKLSQPPPNQLKLTDLNIQLNNDAKEPIEASLRGTVTITTNADMPTKTDVEPKKIIIGMGILLKPFRLPSGSSTFTYADLNSWDIKFESDKWSEAFSPKGVIPPGDYEICVSVIDKEGKEIGKDCIEQKITDTDACADFSVNFIQKRKIYRGDSISSSLMEKRKIYRGDSISSSLMEERKIYRGDSISSSLMQKRKIYKGDSISSSLMEKRKIYRGDSISNGLMEERKIYRGDSISSSLMQKRKIYKGDSIAFSCTIVNNYKGKEDQNKPKTFRIKANNDLVMSVSESASREWKRTPSKFPPGLGEIKWTNNSGDIPNGKISLGTLLFENVKAEFISLYYEWLNKEEKVICSGNVDLTWLADNNGATESLKTHTINWIADDTSSTKTITRNWIADDTSSTKTIGRRPVIFDDTNGSLGVRDGENTVIVSTGSPNAGTTQTIALISPTDELPATSVRPTFEWKIGNQEVGAVAVENVIFEPNDEPLWSIVVREIPEEGEQESGRIVFEQSGIRENTLPYPKNAPSLDAAKKYIWKVIGLRDGIKVASSLFASILIRNPEPFNDPKLIGRFIVYKSNKSDQVIFKEFVNSNTNNNETLIGKFMIEKNPKSDKVIFKNN